MGRDARLDDVLRIRDALAFGFSTRLLCFHGYFFHDE